MAFLHHIPTRFLGMPRGNRRYTLQDTENITQTISFSFSHGGEKKAKDCVSDDPDLFC